MVSSLDDTSPSSGRLVTSPSQHSHISFQQIASNLGSFSGLKPFFTDVHNCSLFWHCSKLWGNLTSLEQIYQNNIPKAYMSTERSYLPPNSSGAMCIGVPTIVQVIMASGLQKPRSVRRPLLLLSSWMGEQITPHNIFTYNIKMTRGMLIASDNTDQAGMTCSIQWLTHHPSWGFKYPAILLQWFSVADNNSGKCDVTVLQATNPGCLLLLFILLCIWRI